MTERIAGQMARAEVGELKYQSGDDRITAENIGNFMEHEGNFTLDEDGKICIIEAPRKRDNFLVAFFRGNILGTSADRAAYRRREFLYDNMEKLVKNQDFQLQILNALHKRNDAVEAEQTIRQLEVEQQKLDDFVEERLKEDGLTEKFQVTEQKLEELRNAPGGSNLNVEAEIKKYQAVIDKASREIADLEEELGQNEDVADLLYSRDGGVDREHAEIEGRLKDLAATRDEAREAIAQLRQENGKLSAPLVQSGDTETIAQLQQELEDLSDPLKQSEDVQEALEISDNLQARIDDLRSNPVVEKNRGGPEKLFYAQGMLSNYLAAHNLGVSISSLQQASRRLEPAEWVLTKAAEAADMFGGSAEDRVAHRNVFEFINDYCKMDSSDNSRANARMKALFADDGSIGEQGMAHFTQKIIHRCLTEPGDFAVLNLKKEAGTINRLLTANHGEVAFEKQGQLREAVIKILSTIRGRLADFAQQGERLGKSPEDVANALAGMMDLICDDTRTSGLRNLFSPAKIERRLNHIPGPDASQVTWDNYRVEHFQRGYLGTHGVTPGDMDVFDKVLNEWNMLEGLVPDDAGKVIPRETLNEYLRKLIGNTTGEASLMRLHDKLVAGGEGIADEDEDEAEDRLSDTGKFVALMASELLTWEENLPFIRANADNILAALDDLQKEIREHSGAGDGEPEDLANMERMAGVVREIFTGARSILQGLPGEDNRG